MTASYFVKSFLRSASPIPMVLTSLALLASCAPAEKPRGQLMIAVATDMSIPKNMDQVVVEVLTEDGVKQTFSYAIRPSNLGKPMPGTLAIVPPNAGGQTVRVRLIAEQDMSPAPPVVRVVREAVVKVPTDRTALLPMPLRWLCDGHYKESEDGSFQSDCPTDQTCVAGACVDAIVAPEQLPTYEPALVFGGGNEQGTGGVCIDVQACFGAAKLATPEADCTLTVPDGAEHAAFNVAIELSAGSDGQCTTGENPRCFLPLDQDAAEGWYVADDDRVHLPPAVCEAIEAGKALGVALTTACHTKDPSVPICGPWTNVATSSMATGGGNAPGGSTVNPGGAPDAGAGGAGGAGGLSLACAGDADCAKGQICLEHTCVPGKGSTGTAGSANGVGGASSSDPADAGAGAAAGKADAGPGSGGDAGEQPVVVSCDSFCADEGKVCGFAASNAPYPSASACLSSCVTYPAGDSGDMSGDSYFCRRHFLTLAATNQDAALAHCPQTGAVSKNTATDTGPTGPCN